MGDGRIADDVIETASQWRLAITRRLPALRAYAVSLTRDRDEADDLIQETLTKAWRHRGGFEPGTNLGAWLFTILRNNWYSRARRRWREVQDEDGEQARRMTSEPDQDWSCELNDVRAAMEKLIPEQREALVLVAAAGLSYEEAATMAGCKVGTVKSRVSRARAQLVRLLDSPSEDREPAPPRASAHAPGLQP